jgi:hypothetical protein
VGGDDVEVGQRGGVLLEDVLDAADAAVGVGPRTHHEHGRARLGRDGRRRHGRLRRLVRLGDRSRGIRHLNVRHRYISSASVE